MSALDIIKDALPFIGTALGGPLGGMAADFIGSKLGIPQASVDTVKQVLSGMDPAQIAQYKQSDDDFRIKMSQMGYDSIEKLEELNANVVIEVNKTMQAEAASEHWPTYSWRPFCGFVFGITFFGTYFILPLAHISPPTIPSEAWIAIGGILGVASFFRGKAQADPAVQSSIQVSQKG